MHMHYPFMHSSIANKCTHVLTHANTWSLTHLSAFSLHLHASIELYILYRHNHNIDLRTSVNEYTSLKNYISLTLYSRKVDVSVVCERWMETGTDCYIDPNSSLDHSSTSSTSWLGLLSLQAGSHSALPVSN